MDNVEELAALCCLWISGLCTKSVYIEKLDELFLKDPESDLLLELEGLSGDKRGSLSELTRHFNEKNAGKFGKALFARIEGYYAENVAENLMSFKRLTDRLRETLVFVLPLDIVNSEPYYSLDFAGEFLDWGDEKQAREMYQKAFDYYKEKP